MSHAATAQDEIEDRYFTQVEAGDVRLFTLDQLDAAFNAGLIHENTYVCLEGDSAWLTLGEVAGLGDEEAEPVSAQLPAPQTYAAAQAYGATPSYSSPPLMLAPSIAPVVNDLSLGDFDSELLSMRPKRRLGKLAAGAAVLALGALGFVVVQSGGLRGLKLPLLAKLDGKAAAASLSMSSLKQEDASARKLLAPTPAPVLDAPKLEASKPEPPKPSEQAAAPSAAAADSGSLQKPSDERFSEDMKAALLNKDKQQAATQKSKKVARSAAASKASSKRKLTKSAKSAKSTGFKSGGSAYDPLNGKL